VRTERGVLLGLVAVLSMLAVASHYLPGSPPVVPEAVAPSSPLVAAGGAAGALVVYGLLGWAGLAISHRLGLPGVFSRPPVTRALFTTPALLGLGVGCVIILLERLILPLHGLGPLPHPGFPLSLVASAAAAIGEEIVFRLFLVSLGILLLKKLMPSAGCTLVTTLSVIFGALAAGASHLPSVMFIYDTVTPLQLPVSFLVFIMVLNGLVGVLGGWQFLQNGLVAAIGVHFWADLAWHVIYGLAR